MYKVFCANQQTSLSAVDTQTKKNPQFKKNLDICHSDPRCRGLFLQSFLIKPIQRVCKYPLLLRVCVFYYPHNYLFVVVVVFLIGLIKGIDTIYS